MIKQVRFLQRSSRRASQKQNRTFQSGSLRRRKLQVHRSNVQCLKPVEEIDRWAFWALLTGAMSQACDTISSASLPTPAPKKRNFSITKEPALKYQILGEDRQDSTRAKQMGCAAC